MNRKRIYCLLISVAMLFSLTACGRENCQEPKQGETLKDYANVGNSTPNSGNGVPIERPEFASMSEVKRFLADNPVADSTMTHIGQYVSENDAASISATADTIPFPVADLSPETTQFTASWIPNNKSLTIIYCINNLQYKFIYFFGSDYQWTSDDEPVVQGAQLGEYVVDFWKRDHSNFEYYYLGHIQMPGVYISIAIIGERVENFTLEHFDFVPLSSVGGGVIA